MVSRRSLLLGAAALATAAAKPEESRSADGEVLEDLTGNLLVNGGPEVASMEGWDNVVNGGDGWAAYVGNLTTCETDEDPESCDANFKTSYQACTRSQIVALEVPGVVDAAMLDSGTVAVVVSEEVREFYEVDKFFIKAALCSDAACKHKVAVWDPCKGVSKVPTEEKARWCETRGGVVDGWHSHGHAFGGEDVARGARYAEFADGGVDSEYWTGYWGPWFRNAHVAVHASNHTFAPTATPYPTALAVPSPEPTAPPSTGYWSHDNDYTYGASDYAYATFPTPAPKPRHHRTKAPARRRGRRARARAAAGQVEDELLRLRLRRLRHRRRLRPRLRRPLSEAGRARAGPRVRHRRHDARGRRRRDARPHGLGGTVTCVTRRSGSVCFSAAGARESPRPRVSARRARVARPRDARVAHGGAATDRVAALAPRFRRRRSSLCAAHSEFALEFASPILRSPAGNCNICGGLAVRASVSRVDARVTRPRYDKKR